MEQLVNFIIQVKGLLTILTLVLGSIYLVRSGAIADITGNWKRRYESLVGERDDLKASIVVKEAEHKAILTIKDAKIKELEDYIKILVLNDKTRMEIELQKHA